MNALDLASLAQRAFGISKREALAQHICIKCKQPPTFTTPEGRREYPISGMCEPCFDGLWPVEEEKAQP